LGERILEGLVDSSTDEQSGSSEGERNSSKLHYLIRVR